MAGYLYENLAMLRKDKHPVTSTFPMNLFNGLNFERESA